jgi:hypothetical protein
MKPTKETKTIYKKILITSLYRDFDQFSHEISDCVYDSYNYYEIIYRKEIDKLIQITKTGQHFSYNALMIFTMNNIKLRKLKIKEILND